MKNLFILISVFCWVTAFAGGSNTVRIYDPSNMVVTGHTDVNFTLGSDNPSGDATSESAPAKVYVPIASGVADQIKYFSLNPSVGELYNIASTLHHLYFPLVITTSVTENYIYAAIKSGTDYKVIGKSSQTYSNVTNQGVAFDLAPKTICDFIIGESGTSCNNLGAASTTELSSPSKFTIYFFQSSTNMTVANHDVISPSAADYSGGVYFEVQMSNNVHTLAELQIDISAVRIGDGRLVLEFSTSAQMSSSLYKKTMVFKNSGAVGVGTFIGDAVGSSMDPNYTSQSGEVRVSPLTNTVPYDLSVYFLDKFLFASTLSASELGTPQKIEELLKKQACFLLTAGFGEEHYVITYFRNIRDQVLTKYWLGRKFINFYYETAPKYALLIYKSEVLRAVIRGLGLFLYFVLRNIRLLSIGLSLIIGLLALKRVRKWQHLKKISQS